MTTGVEQPPNPRRHTADPAPRTRSGNKAAESRPADRDERSGSAHPRRDPGRWRRSASLSLLAMVITPVALGIAANGAVTGGRWWDSGDRWSTPAQSALGALLLLVVAGLAISTPAAGVTAGLVWGIAPAVVQIAAPRETYRLISAVPGLPSDLARALHTWLSSGVVLLFGVLLAGVGIIAATRRHRLAR
ncbi:hypothetical protein ACWCPQ_25990 [Nocardia sp. NPDC001965]